MWVVGLTLSSTRPGCRTTTGTSCTSHGKSNATFGALAILGGVPGTLIGGRIADQWVHRFLGARRDPALCICTSAALFMVSFVSTTFAVVFVVQLVRFLAATACVPALRAGLSDAAPAHLRRTGFGAFNPGSVVFGSAAAPLVTAAIATQFENNFRTAFLVILPIAFWRGLPPAGAPPY